MAYYNKAAGRAQKRMLIYAKNNLDKDTYEIIKKSNNSVTRGIIIYTLLMIVILFIPVINISMNSLIISMILLCISFIIYFILYYKTFGKVWSKFVKWYTKTDRNIPFIIDNVKYQDNNCIIYEKDNNLIFETIINNRKFKYDVSGKQTLYFNPLDDDSLKFSVNGKNIPTGNSNETWKKFCYELIEEIKIHNKEKKIIITKDMKIKEIRGSRWDCRVIFESGQILECVGELYMDGKFIIYNTYQTIPKSQTEIFVDIFNEYKKELIKVIKENNIKLVIDLHGASIEREFDVELGTLNNLSADFSTINELKESFIENGINNIFVNDPFKGGAITQYLYNLKDIDVIQLEINKKYRDYNNLELLEKIIKSLSDFIIQYISIIYI